MDKNMTPYEAIQLLKPLVDYRRWALSPKMREAVYYAIKILTEKEMEEVSK